MAEPFLEVLAARGALGGAEPSRCERLASLADRRDTERDAAPATGARPGGAQLGDRRDPRAGDVGPPAGARAASASRSATTRGSIGCSLPAPVGRSPTRAA